MVAEIDHACPHMVIPRKKLTHMACEKHGKWESKGTDSAKRGRVGDHNLGLTRRCAPNIRTHATLDKDARELGAT